MIKPDGVERGLVGQIVSRLEAKGLRICGMKMMRVDQSLAEQHYGVHAGRPFFPELVRFITSGPVVAMAWEGPQAIQVIRKLVGATKYLDAQPGTIRGDYAVSTGNNLIHASDSPEAAEKELGLFFKEQELVRYERSIDPWIMNDR